MAESNGNHEQNNNGTSADLDMLSEHNLKCPICHNDFTAPKILPCLHSFCFECLSTSLQQSQIGPGDMFLCPLCNEECSVPLKGVAAMKTNIFYVTMQEYVERKSLNTSQICEGCDSGSRPRRKCIDCNDWLCSQCCVMHKKVKMTKEHLLVSLKDLQTGKYDQLIKDSFEPLLCSKHGEPLKLFCTHPMCQAPICTMCKTTSGHDGHAALELNRQAEHDCREVNHLLHNTERCISITTTKLNNLKHEERVTSQLRKQLHKGINSRMEEILELFATELGKYAEALHSEVEGHVKEHKQALLKESEVSKHNLDSMVAAQMFGKTLLEFGRAEELVSMSKEVRDRLHKYQVSPDVTPPYWKQPRLHPPDEIDPNDLAILFGRLTFEGEVVKSAMVKSFTAQVDGDEKVCALCDICITRDHELVLVDRDNRKIKVYDSMGRFKFAFGNNVLRSPNRVVSLRDSNRMLVKDDKALKLLERDGTFVCNFAPSLRQPVGLAENMDGEVLITDWMSGCVHVYNEEGKHQRDFLCASEAAGYVCSTNNGNIAISDWKQHNVKVFSKEGTLLHKFGEYGPGVEQLDHPYGICSDKYGHIIVADTWNNRIYLLAENGHFIKVLLTKEDGVQWPQAVCVNKEGMLIVVEQHGNIKMYQYMA